MKRKLLTTAALGIIILGGVITPMFSFVGSTFGAHVAYAEDTPPPTNATTVDNQRAATEAAQRLDCGTNFICGGVLLISFIMTFVPKALATISGIILDYSIWYTIQSAPYTEQDGADSFVVSGWKLVRDFSNLLFIFALFTIAFSLILNSTGSGSIAGLDPKRTIVRVILMALLVNFSFFLCRVTIDVTNIFARMFYEKISAPVDTSSYSNVNDSTSNGTNSLGSTQEFYTNFVGVRSVSLGILNKVNPQALVLQNGRVQSSQNVVQWFTGWKEYDWSVYILILIVSFITMIFDAFLIYIFVTSFIFLIARTIGLFFFMILSPIAFVSLTIPSLQKKAYFGFDDWVTQFTGLAFTAPIYLFFMYLAVVFLKAPLLDSKATGILAISAVILIKLATIGMILIFGKKITQDLSGKIGAATANVAKAGAMVIGAVATGGAAGFASGGFTGAVTGAASQVGQMGKRYAMEKGKELGEATGKTVFGEEKFAQMQASKSWGAAASFKNFNPRNAWKNKQALLNVGGIATGPGVLGDISQSYRTGKYGNRLYDIAEAKKAKEKADTAKTKAIDIKIEKLKKKLTDEPWNKEETNKELRDLQKERKDIIDPGSSVTQKIKDLSKDLEKEKAEEKKADEKVMASATKLQTVQERLVDNTKQVTEGGKNVGDSAVKLEKINKEVAESNKKVTESAAKVETSNKQVTEGDKKVAESNKAVAAINEELGRAPTNPILKIKQQRATEENTRLTQAHEINRSTHEELLTTHKKVLDENKLLTDEQKKTIAENTKLVADQKAATDENKKLVSALEDLQEKTGSLSIEHAEAIKKTDGLKGKIYEAQFEKRAKEVDAELEGRQRVPKTDTGNIIRNNRAIENLGGWRENLDGILGVTRETEESRVEPVTGKVTKRGDVLSQTGMGRPEQPTIEDMSTGGDSPRDFDPGDSNNYS